MKKLLFILDTFHPEYASTGQLMTELCQHLQYDFDITVIVGIPQYGVDEDPKYAKGTFFFEKFQNINLVRVRTPKVKKASKLSRLMYLVGHFVNALRATFRVAKPDLIYVISQPPIVGGMLGRLTKLFRGGALLYNIQDFNPEQIEAVGYSKMKPLISVAKWLDNRTIFRADKVIVVGRDMYKTVHDRHHKHDMDKVSVINNWINEGSVRKCSGNGVSCACGRIAEYNELYNPDKKFTIMYSGNVGLYYDLENIIKVIGKFDSYEDMQFVFVGGGTKKAELEAYCQEHNLSNVKFFDYVPKEYVQCSLNTADVHLVTNQKGIKGVSVPSKIYGVLAVAKPVFGILEDASEAHMIIEESGCGKSVEPQDYEGIEALIQWFYDHRHESASMGDQGRAYLDDHLLMIDSLEKYKCEIAKLVGAEGLDLCEGCE